MLARLRLELAVVAVAALVIVGIGFGMARLSYDVWAGIVLAPAFVVLMAFVLRRILGPELQWLLPLVLGGYVVKLAGACARYYVVFDAYGKNADAERYFDAGNALAAEVREGTSSFFTLIPRATDAEFIEQLSGLVMVFLGPSRLGGFFVFSTFAYVGTVACIRAAHTAIPGLAVRRYALLCVLAPSLAFWPSSMGKEAWILMCVGGFSVGLAKVLTWQGRAAGVQLAVLSALGMGMVRPHLAAIFAGAATMAFVFGVMLPPEPITARRRGSLLAFTMVAVVAMALTSLTAVRYLEDDNSGDGGLFSGITSVLERTTEQTLQGGSAFEPIDLDNPLRWPYAVARTLTRPLLVEADSLASLLPALETTAFLALLVLSWRRLSNFVPSLRRSPYLMYVLVATVLFGLAFSAVGNLAILVRQRSLVVPFMAVFLALPRRGDEAPDGAPTDREFANA